ncbi:MAG: hypothetical protein D6798_19925 [Deltaproteobacteria bacterium]|nr:MAG: hypothetical protein D6798_19925 [Deltaproteobacteria bacterium]
MGARHRKGEPGRDVAVRAVGGHSGDDDPVDIGAVVLVRDLQTSTEDRRPGATMHPSTLLLPMFVAACDLPGGQDEVWAPHCDEIRTPLDAAEVSPLGFSADDLLVGVGTHAEASLVWTDDGATTRLSVDLSPGAEVYFVDLEEAPVPDDADAVLDIAVICDDYLEVAAGLSLSTDDGLLDDDFDAVLTASTVDAAAFSVDAEPADFAHPEIFDPFATGDYDDEGVALYGEVSAGGQTSGSLYFETEGTDGDTAWAASELVAEWGAVE